MNTAGIIALALWFLIYAFLLAGRLIRKYRKAVRLFDETQSDDIGAYIRWLSVFTWWAVIYGVGCGLFTFIPEKYVFIWILSSIPFYIYLFCSYMNYMLFYEKVETALETEMPESNRQNQPAYYAELEKRLAARNRMDIMAARWLAIHGITFFLIIQTFYGSYFSSISVSPFFASESGRSIRMSLASASFPRAVFTTAWLMQSQSSSNGSAAA